jgi:hypothetical protein
MGPKKHPEGYLKAYPKSVLMYSGQSEVRSGVGGKGVIVGGLLVSVGGTSVGIGGGSTDVQAARMSIIRITNGIFFISVSFRDHCA